MLLSRSTLCDWGMPCGFLLEAVVREMQRDLLEGGYIQADCLHGLKNLHEGPALFLRREVIIVTRSLAIHDRQNMTRALSNPGGGTPLAQLLQADRINLQLEGSDQFEAICTVASLLKDHPAIRDFERVQAALVEREKAASTALGNGVAIPHCRSDHVSEIVMAAGRSRAGVWFGSAQTVHLIFVIATPREQVSQYLKTVGRLAHLCRNPRMVDQLLAADAVEAFLRALETPW